ncbi:hypothetical protein HG536_0A07360 [Torulaspora globosa]|uniref:Altered inheritance of mitochondria protein 41 n=1 Tax=Torulaspora globosa TaxID=48254 RepID=A0A7G3ZBN5_9SACH|nr:uncharacterized protein HG536_0A07360 [Torulaspora globosa]QLL30921.1 hypothetical protein HG536_0A07360 [Torulaspora globosa]
MFRSVIWLVPRSRLAARFASNATYNAALASLKKDLKQAMISKDDVKKTTIRSLLSSIKNKEIDSKGEELNEFSLSEIYAKLINQRTDSIDEFLKNGREDLVAKERQELAIIKSYLHELPVASKEEVDTKVAELLKSFREATPDLQLKQIFGKIDWETLPAEWKASPKTIKSSIVGQFKQNQ